MSKTIIDEIVERFTDDLAKLIFEHFLEHYVLMEQLVSNSMSKRLLNSDIESDWVSQ